MQKGLYLSGRSANQWPLWTSHNDCRVYWHSTPTADRFQAKIICCLRLTSQCWNPAQCQLLLTAADIFLIMLTVMLMVVVKCNVKLEPNSNFSQVTVNLLPAIHCLSYHKWPADFIVFTTLYISGNLTLLLYLCNIFWVFFPSVPTMSYSVRVLI